MSGQQGIVTLKIGYPLEVDDNSDVQACNKLLQAQQISISMRVYGSGDKKGKHVRWEVDGEGWEVLALAMQVKPNGVQSVETSKDWVAQLRRGDTKAISDSICEAVQQFIVHRGEDDYGWDEHWSQCMFLGSRDELEEVLDMSKDEFDAKVDPESEEYIYADGVL